MKEKDTLHGQKRTKCEIWSRSVGYLRPTEQWHLGKQAEFKDRKTYKVNGKPTRQVS